MTNRNADKGKQGLVVVSSWDDVGRVARRLSSFEIFSFLMITAVGVVGAVTFTNLLWVFIVLVTVDGVGTLFQSDRLAAVDRSILFLVLIVFSVVREPSALLPPSAETLFLFVILDVSSFLRKIGDTTVDLSVIKLRIQSYSYTVVPTLLLMFVLILLISLLPFEIPVRSAVVILGASSIGIFVTIWFVVRQLTVFRRPEETNS